MSDLQRSLGMMFRAADVGHTAKSWDLHQAWSNRLVQEFHEQGDEERKLGMKISPLCDRNDFDMSGSQICFLKFICLPTWKELVIFECRIRKLDNLPQERDGEVHTFRMRRPSITPSMTSVGRRNPSKRSRSWARNQE